MIDNKDYKTTSENNVIRFVNFDEFIERVKGNKKNKVAIITIIYNNVKNLETMIGYLSNEKHKALFDFVVIDNSTKKEISDLLEWICSQTPFNTIYVKPYADMGSAGWYSLWSEYCLSEWYEYIFIIEDDVVLIDQWIMDACIENIQHESAVTSLYFIHDCNGNLAIDTPSNGHMHSWYVLFAWYPREFLERVGVIDPRYFFRWEDIERGKRIEAGIGAYEYQKHIIHKVFFHPYMKHGNGSVYWIYFSIRNQIYTHYKYNSPLLQLMFTILLYMQNGFLNLCMGKVGVLRSIYLAVADSNRLSNVTLAFSQEREDYLRQYKSYRLPNLFPQTIKTEQIQDIISDVFMIIPRYQFDSIDRQFIDNKIKKWWKYLLIGWIGWPLSPLFLCFPKIISIEETDYKKRETLSYNIQNNLRRLFIILNIVCLIPTLIMGVVIYFIIKRRKK